MNIIEFGSALDYKKKIEIIINTLKKYANGLQNGSVRSTE